MAEHIEEFAGQLRELKERSGRSYGMLATRLHVSTSTLHRYCNGAAVPGEYAPVERFARQCGASAQELVVLHQRWLLADAAKRREPQRGPARSPDRRPVAEPVQLPPVEGESADLAPGDVASSDAPPELHDVAPESADARPELPHVAHTPAVGGKRPGRRVRRTAVVLAAAAALVAVLLLVPRSSHGADDTGTGASAGGPVTGGKPPVQVTVLSDNWDTQCGQWFLFQQGPAEVPPPPTLEEGNAWAAALGGIPAGHLRLRLTAQGLPGEPVVLHGLYVKVLSSAPAPKGNLYSPEQGCGGGIEPASFAVDLDSTTPRTRAVPGTWDGKDHPAVDFPFRTSPSDPQVLDVDARALDHDVRWYMDLVWTCGARQGTLRIDDHGVPFRTTGKQDNPTYGWSSTRWEAGTMELD